MVVHVVLEVRLPASCEVNEPQLLDEDRCAPLAEDEHVEEMDEAQDSEPDCVDGDLDHDDGNPEEPENEPSRNSWLEIDFDTHAFNGFFLMKHAGGEGARIVEFYERSNNDFRMTGVSDSSPVPRKNRRGSIRQCLEQGR